MNEKITTRSKIISLLSFPLLLLIPLLVFTPERSFGQYCVPTSTYTSDYLKEVSSDGALVDVNYTTNGFDNEYVDKTGLTFISHPGQTFDIITEYVGGSNGVGIWVDWNQNDAFTDSGESYGGNGGTAAVKTQAVSVPGGTAPGVYRMRVRGQWQSSGTPPGPCGNISWGNAVDFNLEVVAPPSCFPALNLDVTINDPESVDLNWSAPSLGSTPDGYEYEVSSSSTPGAGTFTAGTSVSNYTVTPGSTNYLHVRTDCGSGDYSDWSTKEFTVPPYGQVGDIEGVENYMPVYTLFNYGYSQQIHLANELTSLEGPYITKIRFYYHENSTDSNKDAWKSWRIYMGNTNKTAFSSTTDWVSASNMEEVFYGDVTAPALGNWMEITLDQPFLWDEVSNLVIGVIEDSPGYSSYAKWGVQYKGSNRSLYYYTDGSVPSASSPPTASYQFQYINTLQLISGEEPDCLQPLGFTASANGLTEVDLSWTAGDATEWNVEYGLAGFTQGTGTTISGLTTAGTTISPLTEGESYDFYVQAVCDGSETSSWAGPRTVDLFYCEPTTTGNLAFINNFSATGGLGLDIVNNNSGQGLVSGYSDYTSQSVSVGYQPGASIDYSLSMNGTSTAGLKVWVDFDGNGTFSNNEMMYQSAGYSSSYSGNISFDGIQPGNYRMRFGVSYTPNDGPNGPCGHSGSGEYEDYTVTVVEMEGCTSADAGTISDFEVCSDTEFTLSSTGVSFGEDGLTYEWFASTDGGSNWTSIYSGNPVYTVSSGITAETMYKLVVTCANGGSDESTVTVSMKTANECYCEPAGSAPSYGGISNFTTTGGLSNNIANSSGASSVYTDYSSTHFVDQLPNQSFDFTAASSGDTGGWGIWVDWNQNGVFEANEREFGPVTSYTTNISGTITIPSGATPGNYRMRVVYNWMTMNVQPCGDLGSAGYGEAEDYTITVVALDGCTEAVAGTVSLSTNVGGPNSTYTVSATGMTLADGITYQWQSNTNNGGWVDEGSSSSSYSNYTATAPSNIGDEVAWRLKVTCDAAGATDYSTNDPVFEVIDVCDWTVHVWSSGWGDETNWTLKDAGGNTVLSGGTYSLGFDDTQTTSHAGPLTFSISDYGFFGDNEAEFTVSNTDGVIVIGQMGSTAQTFSDLSCDDEALEECSGTPDGGTASSNMSSGESGSDITFTVTGYSEGTVGLSYDWEYSTDGGITWESVGTGGDDVLLTVTGQHGTVFLIRYAVACSNSGLTGYSNEVTFTVDESGCIPVYSATSDQMNNFSIADFSHATTNSNNTSSGYGDFTSTFTPIILEVGESYVASLTSNGGTGTHSAAIWIDFDDDNFFSESEKIATVDGIGASQTVNFSSFTLGAEHVGTHRMRVVYQWNVTSGNLNPCADASYGEAADYMVNIIELESCVEAVAGTVSLSANTGGTNTTYTVSATGMTLAEGLTYQWQSNTNNNGWVDEGSSSASYSNYTATAPSNVGDEVAWRLKVTCDASGETDYSTNDPVFEVIETCDWTVHVWTSGYGDATTWTLKDEDGTTVLSGGTYSSYGFNDTQTISHPGPLTFSISDYGFFGDNEAEFTVSNTSGIIVTGQMGATAQTFSSLTCADDPLVECSGTPDGGIATSNMSTGQSGSTVNFTVTGYDQSLGLSYIWEYSFDDGATWTASATSSDDASFIISGPDGTVTLVRYAVTCANSGLTGYSNEVVFTVDQTDCIPLYVYTSDYMSAFSTTGAQTNVSLTWSSHTAYQDLTGDDPITVASAGDDFNFSTTYVGGSNTIRVWVDWNQDGQFDESELMASEYTSSAANGGTITVPSNTIAGTYKMRVRSSFSSALIGPCDEANYGSAIDLTLIVEEGATACTGTPDGGTLVVNPLTAAPGDLFNASVTGYTEDGGISYVWEYRINGGAWQTLGAPDPSSIDLTFGAGEPGDVVEIRLAVYCVASQETGYSNIGIHTVVGPDTPCVPFFTYADDQMNNFSIAGYSHTTTNSDNTSSGYGDFTSSEPTIDLEVGEEYIASLTSSSGSGTHSAAIWIDFNGDNFFSESEKIATVDGVGPSQTVNFSAFTLGNEHIGTHRMRVIYQYGVTSGNLIACPDDFYGEAADYMVNVYSDVACDDYPIIVNNVMGKTTASFTWEEIPGSAEIQIRYKKQGAAVNWTYVNLPGDATGVELTGLHHETDYYIQSSSRCEGSSTFGARMPINLTPSSTQGKFSTLPLDLCDYPPVEVSAGEVTTTSIEVQWDIVGDISVYNLRYKVAGASTPWIYVELDPTSTSYLLTGLSVNTDYYVQVRTMCETDDDYSVLWSTVVMLSTDDFGDCSAAPSLNVEETTSNAVFLTWTPIAGAEMYDIRYKKAGVGGWMHKFVPGDQSSTWLTGLASGVPYYIQASTKCIGSDIYGDRNPPISATPTAQGGGSGLAKYEDEMTSDEVKVNDEISVTDEMEVVMYPNPTSGVLNIDVVLNDAIESGDVEVHVYDMSGRIVNNTSSYMNSGFNNVRLHLGELTTGLYNVVLYKDGVAIHRGKVQKQ